LCWANGLEIQLIKAQERLKQQRDEFKNKDMRLKAKIEALEEKALQASQNYEETEIM
jgi:multidrug resistance efflux pump